MNLEDLQNIDINDIPSWPLPIKLVAIFIVCAAILTSGFFFLISGQLDKWDKEKRTEQKLKESYLGKKAIAVNLPAYRQQMEDMERTFDSLRRQLPSKTEIPDILVDITQAGLGRGLQFSLFDPGNEAKKDFYAELPIRLVVKGSYHELAMFISDIAALPRIVTIGNIRIKGKAPRLTMSAIAKTYRSLEISESSTQTGKKRRRGR